MSPSVFALFVLLGGALTTGSGALYVQIVFCLFGAAAAVALPALGGSSLMPATLFLPFLLWRAMRERSPHAWSQNIPVEGFWYGLSTLWAVLSAILMPRAFTGETQVMTIDRSTQTSGLMWLHPVSGNFTQSCYALGSLCAFLVFRALLEPVGRLEHFRNAVLLLAAMNCGAAVLNLAEYYLGLPSLLELCRTADYAVYAAYEEAGLVRIQGTFTETSAFSAFSLPLFAFSFSLWLDHQRPAYSGLVALGSLTFLLLSTSGTAYAGLAAYAVCVAISLTWRRVESGNIPRVAAIAITLLILLVAAGSAFVFELGPAKRVIEFFDHTLVSKIDSKSGIERASWNTQAWRNFTDTYGAGVGLGSARASGYLFALLSNVGIIGTTLQLVFLAKVLKSKRNAGVHAFIPRAAKQAVIATLVVSALSAGSYDLGILFAALAAAATYTPAHSAVSP